MNFDKKLYIFDMGGVVIKGIYVIPKMAGYLGVDEKWLQQDYMHYAFPLMDGVVSMKDYYQHLRGQLCIKVPGDPMVELFTPYINPLMQSVIKKIRDESPQARIVCGSNTYEGHWTKICNQGWQKCFDYSYCSHLIHLTKPFPGFYNHILNAENVKAEDALFIDDYIENIEGAQRVGIEGLLYDSDDKFKKIFGI